MPKETPNRKKPRTRRDMRPEYRFDYTKAKPNRFAEAMLHDGR